MDTIYIPLGLDCSIAYNLRRLNLNYYSLIFDWSYIPNILDLIDILLLLQDDNFNILLDESNYEIIELKSNTHHYNDSNYATHKLVHKKYKLQFNHEISNISTFNDFKERYSRRVKRFMDLKNSDKKLVFIRLGTTKDINHLPQLNTIIENLFGEKSRLIFIDSTEYKETTSWKREEIDWLKLLELNLFKDINI